MKLDSNSIRRLLSLPDDRLWALVSGIAEKNGMSLSKTPPPPQEMAKLRRVLAGLTDSDVAKALELLNQWKKG